MPRPSLACAFGPNSIAFESEPVSFDQAVTRSIGLLELDGRVTKDYSAAVIAGLDLHGPYFVVAPGVAIAHAAPSAHVLEVGFALLKLEHPAVSGSHNDPVSLVFSFCTTNPDEHIELLADFGAVLSEPNQVNLLLKASAESEIRMLLRI